MTETANDNDPQGLSARIAGEAARAALRAIAQTISEHPDSELLPDKTRTARWAMINATVAAFMGLYPGVDVVPLIEKASRLHFDFLWAEEHNK